ncbi:uncharacterized protein CDV56_100868 [Aspergillus thermomutatus]|uniref:Uncharacterized protein n=1 Tax=Aspergillus thermomutatus TaxID=41047 RepID=A0A397H302_ASPTH|nr:uncharacterized protein CDV56_100868 [Aspergillus thermomutatus]RHZ57462.1 hypothetical protein CDV56_100868 [Aspergillus thermomutatus]
MTDLPYDYTSWQFLDAIGQASTLQPQLQTDEAMSLAFEFPSHGHGECDFAMLSSDNCLAYGQTSAKTAATGFMHTHSPPVEMAMFAQGMEFRDAFISVPPFPDLTPDTDLSLLRSTSHNATERALFMTIPSSTTSPSSSSSSSSSSLSSTSNQQFSSPTLDPCTPSTTSKESDEDWDRELGPNASLHFYKLPDRLDSIPPSFQSVQRHQRHVHHPPPRVNSHHDDEAADTLTPLEMPDGSTRFTANWLPVDPTGGFTIGFEDVSVSQSASAMEFGSHGYGYGQAHGVGDGYDPVSMEFSKEAFIQMPA